MLPEDDIAKTLPLWYGDVLIGVVKSVVLHQGTRFGVLERAVDPYDTPVARRIADFIQFCEEWNERVEISDETSGPPPAVEEFDQYEDVIKSNSWAVKTAAEEAQRIDEAPLFFGGELSWRLSEQAPANKDTLNN